MKVTYRQIARLLVRELPLDNEERVGKVDEYTKAIEAMPEQARLALQSAYIFSSKVPPKEREDLFQDIVYAVLQKSKDGKDGGGVAYMTGRGKWLDGLGCGEHKKKRQPSVSLNEVITEQGRQIEVGETIVGMDDLEDKVINRVEAQRIYRELPRHIKLLVKRMFRGEALLPKERSMVFRYRRKLYSKYPDYQYQVSRKNLSD